MKKRKRFLLFSLLILLFPLLKDKQSTGSDILVPKELVKPLNQRILNSLSDFQYSTNIDQQVERFMERSALKGVSVAVVKDEKLVFCKTYGYANEEEKIPVAPEHLFRIASISKLITAVAVMKLVENGKLALNDPVFGEKGFFNDKKYLNIRDPKLKDIKVIHLLNHSSGWTQRYGDPMFNGTTIARKMGHTPPATLDTYLEFAVSRRLFYKPGSMYSYSNMAYIFLDAIIEKASGMKYEDYVRYHILYPNGIYDMYIGDHRYENRRINEVRYYEQEGSLPVRPFSGDTTRVPKSYGGNDIQLLSGAGGWIASAPELAKFMTLIDGFDDVPDCLSKESIDQMTGALGNPLGWRETVGGYWYRTGSFAGTAAMIHRRPDGMQWVFLSNTSNWQGPEFSKDINQIMNFILRRVDDWPHQNLFEFYDAANLSYAPLQNHSN